MANPAFLTGGGSQGTGTTQSYSQDCTGASILIAGVWSVGNINTGVTYNGVAMTLIGSAFQYNTGEYLYIYYLVNPTTGSNTLSASFSNSSPKALRSACFSNTSITGIPDSRHDDSGATGNAVGTTTTVADNCIGVMIARFESGDPSASTNMTSASGDFAGSFAIIGYSAIKTPAGSLSMTATSTNTTSPQGSIIISLAPVSVPLPKQIRRFNQAVNRASTY